MKRTTLVLEEDLLRRIKQEALRHGETFKSYVNSLLRKAISRRSRTKPYKLRWKPVKGLLKPGVNIADRDALYDVMEGRR